MAHGFIQGFKHGLHTGMTNDYTDALLWTMPDGSLRCVKDHEPIQRYGDEAFCYQRCKAQMNLVGTGLSPQHVKDVGPKVWYGEVMTFVEFYVWYNSCSDKYLREKLKPVYQSIVVGSEGLIVKLSSRHYVKLQPGETVEPIEFGTIKIEHHDSNPDAWSKGEVPEDEEIEVHKSQKGK